MDEYVGGALEAKVQGNAALYEQLISEIENCQELESVLKLFSALTENAAIIASHHSCFSELLSMLFQFDWGDGEEKIAISFEQILISLVSANVGFLEPCFHLLCKNLLPKSLEDLAEEQNNDDESDEIPNTTNMEDLERRMDSKCSYIHRSFRALLRIAPLGCTTLLPVLIDHFPHRFREARIQRRYVKEILNVSTYVPVLREKILALVVEKMVLIDVEIRIDELNIEVELEVPEEAEKEQVEDDAIFDMDDDANVKSGKGVMEAKEIQPDEEIPVTISKDIQRVRDLADTLDGLMVELMDYMDKQVEHSKRHARMFFKLFLNIFDRFVLGTSHTKFVQFLIFYICQKRAEFVDSLIERLLQYALSDKTKRPLRLCAASFIGSFIARATYLRRDSIQSALLHVTNWIHDYVNSYDAFVQKQRESGIYYDDPNTHAPFYSICLAAIYSTIYKGAELGHEFLASLKWDTITNSKLQPLRYLSKDVVAEFKRFAAEYGVEGVDTNSKLPPEDNTNNDPTDQSKDKWKVGNDTKHYQLEMTYPFDPYRLKVSSERIHVYYQDWFGTDEDHHMDSDEEQYSDDTGDESEGSVEFSKEHIERLQKDGKTLPPAIKIPKIKRAAHMLGALGALGADDAPEQSFWGVGFAKSMSYSSAGIRTGSLVMADNSYISSPRSISSHLHGTMESSPQMLGNFTSAYEDDRWETQSNGSW